MTIHHAHRAHHHKASTMDLYLVSASKHPDITRPLLDRIAEALEFQLYQHVAPFAQSAGVRVFALSSIEALPDNDSASPLVIYDDPDQAGALGWHTYNEGKIHGTAFVNPILDNEGTLISGPNSLSAVLSHEAIEASMDPYVNLYAMMDDGVTIEPVEGCDRVQGDSYEIGGVAVSNFLGPRAFRTGPGPYDWLGKLDNPWDIAPGGYCQRFNIKTGKFSTHWGREVPAWKRDLVLKKRELSISRLSKRKLSATEHV
jgi:hypothetical protein